MKNKYIVECIGAFTLSFVVLAAVSGAAAPIAIPVIAGLTLGLFVYTIGAISGSHINPAVTIGLLSVKKITTNDAVMYIVAQILGAAFAIVVAKFLSITMPSAVAGAFNLGDFIAEALGAFIFAWGIAAVVYGKVRDDMSGLVVGGSLLLGLLVSSLAGGAGILNPAVAFALNAVSITCILAPIVGAVVGFQAYRMVLGLK
jgi:glycerol uptake facilitator-like aquaporin